MLFYLKLTGSLQYSLDIWVCKEGSTGVGVLQEKAHRATVQALYFHMLLTTLPQAAAKHGPAGGEKGGQKPALPVQCFETTVAPSHLKYWLAAASTARWQGNSCPWTHRTTSVSSLFTRRVSIPLCSSMGRPSSSQRNSLERVGLFPSSSRPGSSARGIKGPSVVLSKDSPIFYVSKLARTGLLTALKKTCAI